jgi:hypothetical protein
MKLKNFIQVLIDKINDAIITVMIWYLIIKDHPFVSALIGIALEQLLQMAFIFIKNRLGK